MSPTGLFALLFVFYPCVSTSFKCYQSVYHYPNASKLGECYSPESKSCTVLYNKLNYKWWLDCSEEHQSPQCHFNRTYVLCDCITQGCNKVNGSTFLHALYGLKCHHGKGDAKCYESPPAAGPVQFVRPSKFFCEIRISIAGLTAHVTYAHADECALGCTKVTEEGHVTCCCNEDGCNNETLAEQGIQMLCPQTTASTSTTSIQTSTESGPQSSESSTETESSRETTQPSSTSIQTTTKSVPHESSTLTESSSQTTEPPSTTTSFSSSRKSTKSSKKSTKSSPRAHESSTSLYSTTTEPDIEPWVLILVFSLLGVVLLIITIIFLIFWVRRRKNKKKQGLRTEDLVTTEDTVGHNTCSTSLPPLTYHSFKQHSLGKTQPTQEMSVGEKSSTQKPSAKEKDRSSADTSVTQATSSISEGLEED